MSREVGGAREREEMRRWVRGEFDRWKHTTDEVWFSLDNCTHIHCTVPLTAKLI